MITQKQIKRPNNGKKRINTRVDFTPMVDMMMLLLTFFMFCTTLSRPQVMDIAMPTKDIPKDTPPDTPDSRAITFILAENNKVYYYEGRPNYDDYTSLKEINYTQLRNVVLQKNKQIVQQVNNLNKKKKAKQISDEEYNTTMKEIKKDKQGAVATIKPTKDAIFQNLVDVLDEMAICSIGRYAVMDMLEADEFLIKNYETKGLYAQGNVAK